MSPRNIFISRRDAPLCCDLVRILGSDDYLKNQKWRGYTNVDILKSKQKVRIKELILNNLWVR